MLLPEILWSLTDRSKKSESNHGKKLRMQELEKVKKIRWFIDMAIN